MEKIKCKSCGAEFLAKPGQKFCISCRMVSFHLAIASRKQKDKRPKITPTDKKQATE